MAIDNATPVRALASEPLLPRQSVRRHPFYLESQGQALFAWLHRPDHAPVPDHGVLICPPVGHEQVHAHRSLRHLADALAEAGFPVLRIDYHGTGDSGGSDEDPDRVATWLANIRDARTWLQEQIGCRCLSLIGLRLGAILAAQVSAGAAVDGLVLWAPVMKGRLYVREMKALSLTASDSTLPSAEMPGSIEAAGFVLTDQTAQELSRLDLLQCRPQCRRALIVARDDTPEDTKLLSHFQACGIQVEQTAQPGYSDMMAEPHYSKVPHETIARTASWLTSALAGSGSCVVSVPQPTSALLPGFANQPIRERALCISQHPNLFGIVTESASAASAGAPFIVLLNAGSAYRVGPNRLYVHLTRQLAALGFRCFRLDLCGLGDSVTTDRARENDPYPATAFRDIALTLQHVQAELGAQRVVLMGLCSGAYDAFQAAAQMANPVLVECVLINPLTYFWREGMIVDDSPTLQRFKSFQESIRSALRPKKWLKLLSGRSKMGIAGAMRILLERWRLRKPAAPSAPLRPRDSLLDSAVSHPPEEDLAGDLARVTQAGRHVACFFSRSDPGHGILTFYAGRQVRRLCRAGTMSIYFLEADHTFSRSGPRRALSQAIVEHLSRRYLL